METYKVVNGLISLEVWKFGSLRNCKWTDKFGSLEVVCDDKFKSLEVYKLCVVMISLEVYKFTCCV